MGESCFRRDFFKIDSYDDAYKAVGKITQASQEWENQYKSYVSLIELDFENLHKASLNKINNILFENGKITEKDYRDLEKVIKYRNYINHEFFLKDFMSGIENINKILNEIQFYIFEAMDVITNLISEFKGRPIRCPTTFD